MSDVLNVSELTTPDETVEVSTADYLSGRADADYAVNAAGREYDPATGRFASPNAEAPAEEPAADEAVETEVDPNADSPAPADAEAESAPETDTEAAAEEAAAPEPVKIAVPDFLHDRFGAEMELPAGTDPKVVEMVRWSANNAVRQSEVRESRQAAEEFYQRAVLAVEEASALRTQMAALASDPVLIEELARIEEIRTLHGDYMAQLAAADLAARMTAPVEERRTQVQTQLQEQTEEMQAMEVIRDLYDATAARYTHWGENDHLTAIRAFGAAWEASGRDGVPTAEDYARFADSMYVQHPKYREEYEAQERTRSQAREKEIAAKAKAEALAEQKKQMEAAATARTRNPLGRVPAAGNVARVDAAPAEMSTADMLRSRGIA